MKRFNVLAISGLLLMASVSSAGEEHFKCSGEKNESKVYARGAVDRSTGDIRVGAYNSSPGRYKQIFVRGKAEILDNTIRFSGNGGGDYASGHIVLGDVYFSSRLYSNEFDYVPLVCESISKPQVPKVCGGRWLPCLDLLQEPSCCYESPR